MCNSNNDSHGKSDETYSPVMAISDIPSSSVSFEPIKRVFSVGALGG